MADAKRRFRGPAGAIFVPAGSVDEATIAQHVKRGEWTPVEDKAPEPKPEPKKPARNTKR